LPDAVWKYLKTMLCGERALAWLIVNRNGKLLDAGGQFRAHGLDSLPPGDDVSDSVPFLHGLLPADSDPIVLCDIEVAPNHFSDLHIFSDGDRDWVLFLDSTEENVLRRKTENALRASEERLRQALRMETLGRLAGGVAHDFNNLLTVITGYSQFLLDGLRPEDPLRMSAEQIYNAASRASRLTNQLLAFSRKQVVRARSLDLNAIVNDMLEMLRRLIGENIHLETRLDPELGRVKADAGQIEQVIVNLVVNSRDAMLLGGLLRIETANVLAEAGPSIMLSIIDTGCGMDRDTKSRIFEPFFTTKEPGSGTGLGLSTVYGIIRQIGGEVWVYSEPGRGTTFKICLPRITEPVDKAEEHRVEPESPRGSETVLVVEDEEIVRKLACQSLRHYGYQVVEAANAGEALLACERHNEPIPLMVTDVVMPQLSGRELAARLSHLHPEMRVLYMSGYTSDTAILHGLSESTTMFLPKPFTPDALAHKVREVLDR
jgi:two-component system cell cycle sensor histidine kinase/response regulator CckA